MDYGRHSHMPTLNRQDTSGRNSIGRKSTVVGLNRFKHNPKSAFKDMKKYATNEAQKMVKDKIEKVLVATEVVTSIEEIK